MEIDHNAKSEDEIQKERSHMMTENQNVKKTNKQIKQKQKDARRQKNKTSKVNMNSLEKPILLKIPNLKNVPDNCKHLVKEDDLVYVVPGDGCCGPNCGAAFLFQDEVFGRKLRKGMNVFFANHWYDKYQFLTQCSTGHPFVRMVKGKVKSFTDPRELIKYLKTSEDAAYMWSDSEDFAILSDMYQVKIKIITTKGEKDDKPTVNLIHPDLNMAKFAELRGVDLGEMVLLHEDESHFNLVVGGESDLASLGSQYWTNEYSGRS